MKDDLFTLIVALGCVVGVLILLAVATAEWVGSAL